jgi:hypothetical protein
MGGFKHAFVSLYSLRSWMYLTMCLLPSLLFGGIRPCDRRTIPERWKGPHGRESPSFWKRCSLPILERRRLLLSRQIWTLYLLACLGGIWIYRNSWIKPFEGVGWKDALESEERKAISFTLMGIRLRGRSPCVSMAKSRTHPTMEIRAPWRGRGALSLNRRLASGKRQTWPATRCRPATHCRMSRRNSRSDCLAHAYYARR